MEQKHRNLILENVDYMVENTPDEVFERLVLSFSADNGLSEYMINKINKGTSDEKKRKFYEMVPRRGPLAFKKLCNCFYEVGLGFLTDHLKQNRLAADGNCFSKSNGSSNHSNHQRNYEECYEIASKPKGHVLIININKFQYHSGETRHGSELDVAYLKRIWTKMDYEVVTKNDLDLESFKETIDDFIDLTRKQMLDSVFVFIMTHGKRNEKNHKEVDLKMYDSQYISSEWVVERFSTPQCKHIADKPKCILIQACRGNVADIGTWVYDSVSFNSEKSSMDGPRKASPKPHYSNLLVVYSTLPGFVSRRNPKEGAPFIQELCRLIEEKALTKDLLEILHEVDRNLIKDAIRRLKKKHKGFLQINNHLEYLGFNKKLYLI